MKKHLLMLFAAVMVAAMSLNAQTIVIDEGFENGIQDSVWTQEYVSGHTAWAVEDLSQGLSFPSTVKQGTKRAYLRNTTGETQGYVTRLVSKVVDLSPRKVYQPQLTFWYANPRWGADRDTLRVLYRNNVNGKWKRLAEFSTAMANWQKVTLELPEVGSTYQIAFEGTDNLGRGIVLDSVKLRSAPECTVPTRLTASNKGADRVNLSWTASWDAVYFEVIVSRDTIDPYTIEELDSTVIAYHGLVSGFQQFCLKGSVHMAGRFRCPQELHPIRRREGLFHLTIIRHLHLVVEKMHIAAAVGFKLQTIEHFPRLYEAISLTGGIIDVCL